LQAEEQRIVAGLQEAHEEELEQRAAAMQALSNAATAYAQTQAAIARATPVILPQSQNCTRQADPISGIGDPTYRMHCSTY
jgi:hypothetical protein